VCHPPVEVGLFPEKLTVQLRETRSDFVNSAGFGRENSNSELFITSVGYLSSPARALIWPAKQVGAHRRSGLPDPVTDRIGSCPSSATRETNGHLACQTLGNVRQKLHPVDFTLFLSWLRTTDPGFPRESMKEKNNTLSVWKS